MTTKNEKEILVLKTSLSTTLEKLVSDTGSISESLMQKVSELNLEIGTSLVWQYRNCDGRPDTVFDLEMCIPIKEMKGDSSPFQYSSLKEFKCIATTHHGSWSRLSSCYEKLMGFLYSNKYNYTGISREIYHVCDFENQDNCITEVQVGIQ